MPKSDQATRLRAIIEESIGMAYDVSKGLCPLDLDPDPARAGQHDAATVQGSSACQHAQVPGGFAPGSSGQQQQLQKVQVHVGHVPSRIVVPQQQQLPGLQRCSSCS